MRGLKAGSVFIDEWKEFTPKTPYGSPPLVKLVKELRFFSLLREAQMIMFRGYAIPEDLLTRPDSRAGPGESNVEQQTEEEDLQLPPQDEGKS